MPLRRVAVTLTAVKLSAVKVFPVTMEWSSNAREAWFCDD